MDSCDPSTRRFLNRSAKPQQTNPYVPCPQEGAARSGDPAGMLVAPLSLLGLLLGKKKKRGKWELFAVILVLGLSLGMSLTACNQAQITQFSTDEYDVKIITTPISTGEVAFSATISTNLHAGAGAPVTNPLVNVHCYGTLLKSSIENELEVYGVSLIETSPGWTDIRKVFVLIAVKNIANRFTEVVGGNPEEVFESIYGKIDLEWVKEGEVDGLGWCYNDSTIKFYGLYVTENLSTRIITHELGHLLDRKVCANRRADGKCDDVFVNSARTDLTDVWNDDYCNNYLCLSRNSHTGPNPGEFWGFSGGWEDWQFGADADAPAEVFADMFVGWVFNCWGDDRFGFGNAKRDYMNEHMQTYLNDLK